MGIFNSMTSVMGTVVGMGMSTSGVREIAEATGAGEEIRIARTATAMRWIALRLGVVGSVLLAAFSVPVSRLTFGTTEHAGKIALLSLVILIGAVAERQVSLLQGFRRMGDLARVAILGAILSLALALPVVYLFQQDSIVALLLIAAGASLASSWWYARRITIVRVSMTWRDVLQQAGPFLRLGIASMSAALMVTMIAYVVRVVIARHLGFEAAGMYQAATTLSGVYCGFILSAMGADFLPSLSSVASDDKECNRLVNEQVEVGLLLAFPGVCATLAFAPWIVTLLYSGRFDPATEVLRWQVLGVLLRVASWPMGYLLIAKRQTKLYFWAELSYNVLYAGLIWLCVQLWGLTGTGIAFFGLYVYYCLLMYIVTRRLSGFSLSISNKRFSMVAIPTALVIFVSPMILTPSWQFIAAGAITVFAGLYSARMLLLLTGCQSIRDALADRMKSLRVGDFRAALYVKVTHG